MYKLVSKNPVLRFKLGKKIVKALFGTTVKENGVITNSAGVPIGNINGKYNPSIMTLDFSKREEYPANGTYYESKDSSGKVVDKGRYFGGKKHSLPIGNSSSNKTTPKKSDGTSFLTNDLTQRVLDASANPVKKVSNTPRNPGAYHNIITWQNKLKDFYEPGTFKVDGVWGKNTENAYLKYLQLVNVPEMSLEEAKVATTPKLVQFANPVNNVTPVQVPQLTYNRTQIREFLRNKGVNPYNFSGDQRRALRMVLNGQGTDEDKSLIQSMGIFKKGGTLPSKNIVTRFKNRKFN